MIPSRSGCGRSAGPPAGATDAGRPARARAAVGLLLLAPAAAALVVSYLAPTVELLWMSLRAPSDGAGRGDGLVGLAHFRSVLGSGEDDLSPGGREVVAAFGNSFVYLWWGLLTVVVAAPLLAWVADRAGRWARRTVRLVLAAPMVCFAPVALATGWGSHLAETWPGPGRVAWVAAVSGFGTACGVAVTLYLAALRRPAGSSRRPAVAVVAGLATIATAAVALQVFTFPYGVTRGHPRRNRTLMVDVFQDGWLHYQAGSPSPVLGEAAARAVLVLLPLMVLGVGAAILIIGGRVRLELAPRAPRPALGPGRRLLAALLTVLGLAAVLALAGHGLRPWLSGLGDGGAVEGAPPVPAYRWPWLPSLISTVVGVGAAALAGYAVGVVRPLGRRSELLLLPFAPWLFVSIGPLFVAHYQPLAREHGLAGLIPPVWLVVPAVFVFAVLFRGLAAPPAGGGAVRHGRVVALALPTVFLIGAATWLVQSQSLLWGLLVTGADLTGVAFDDGDWRAELGRLFVQDGASLPLVPPVAVFGVFAVLLAVLQLTYLDRFALRVGEGRVTPSVTSHPPAPGRAP